MTRKEMGASAYETKLIASAGFPLLAEEVGAPELGP
jgi:hypothetical protein